MCSGELGFLTNLFQNSQNSFAQLSFSQKESQRQITKGFQKENLPKFSQKESERKITKGTQKENPPQKNTKRFQKEKYKSKFNLD